MGAGKEACRRGEGKKPLTFSPKLTYVVTHRRKRKRSVDAQQLSEELTSTENRVAFARQGFNDAVMSYNTYRQSFPNIVIANQFGHREDAELLEFEDSAEIQAAPNVSFS